MAVSIPVLFAVDEDASSLADVERELVDRYCSIAIKFVHELFAADQVHPRDRV